MRGKTKWEKVPNEKHLYIVRHKDAHGRWSKTFYGIFSDWQSKRRVFPLGEYLATARDRLGELRRLNAARHDFDEDKRKKKEAKAEREREIERAYTLGEFADHYFEVIAPTQLEIVKKGVVIKQGIRQSTLDDYKEAWRQSLAPHFGKLPCADIGLTEFARYESANPQLSPGVAGNRLALVKRLLRYAYEAKKIPMPPLMKIAKTTSGSYDAVTAEQYEAIIAACDTERHRRAKWYFTIQRQAAMRPGEPKLVTWAMCDFQAGMLRVPGYLLKEKKDRRTPMTWELRECLQEIKKEQRVTDLEGHVLVRANGKKVVTVRAAWAGAIRRAGLKGRIVQHGLRKTAITDWATRGIPESIVRVCCGHARGDVHSGYEKFEDRDLCAWFDRVGLTTPPAMWQEMSKPLQYGENSNVTTLQLAEKFSKR